MLYVNYENYDVQYGEVYSMGIQWRRVLYGDTVEKGTVWEYSGERYCMGIQWRRVLYGDTVEKGAVWEYSGEGYSMGIQWRRVLYGDTVEKGTVWGYSCKWVENDTILASGPHTHYPCTCTIQQLKESQQHVIA